MRPQTSAVIESAAPSSIGSPVALGWSMTGITATRCTLIVRIARTECSSSDGSLPTTGSDSTVPDHICLGEILLLLHPGAMSARPSASVSAAARRILTMSP